MILKAINISSQSSGICLFFKVFSFSLIIGSKIVGEIKSNSSSKLDKYFKEFNIAAEGASIKEDFLPVIIFPSGISKAIAERVFCLSFLSLFSSFKSSNLFLAKVTTFLSSSFNPRLCIINSALLNVSKSVFPFL